MSRLTVDLIEKAQRRHALGDDSDASYYLLLALVAALDPDVNVSDAVREAERIEAQG